MIDPNLKQPYMLQPSIFLGAELTLAEAIELSQAIAKLVNTSGLDVSLEWNGEDLYLTAVEDGPMDVTEIFTWDQLMQAERVKAEEEG